LKRPKYRRRSGEHNDRDDEFESGHG